MTPIMQAPTVSHVAALSESQCAIRTVTYGALLDGVWRRQELGHMPLGRTVLITRCYCCRLSISIHTVTYGALLTYKIFQWSYERNSAWCRDIQEVLVGVKC